LTNDAATNTDPSWSPDRSRIAYSADGKIWVMNADGSGKTQITTGTGTDFEPAWSPDGSRIAFVSFRSSQTDLWAIAPNGSGQVQLTTTSGSPSAIPSWSPDGSRLAFGAIGDIYVMNATAGSSATKLTTNPFSDTNPDWSPDGTKIAYAANSMADPGDGSADNFYEITVMNADGSNPVAVTSDSEFDLEPAWSPDGSRLVYTIGTTNGRLVTIRSTGSDQQPLVPGSLSPNFRSYPPIARLQPTGPSSNGRTADFGSVRPGGEQRTQKHREARKRIRRSGFPLGNPFSYRRHAMRKHARKTSGQVQGKDKIACGANPLSFTGCTSKVPVHLHESGTQRVVDV
jgi:dipeptidyl aminopeptidase/acylaminoacyl peptidase